MRTRPLAAFILLLSLACRGQPSDLVPAPGSRYELVAPLDSGEIAGIGKVGTRSIACVSIRAPDAPLGGGTALRIVTDGVSGNKGSVRIRTVPIPEDATGMFFFAEFPEGHNVGGLALEVTDTDGEMLIARAEVPSGASGWRRFDFSWNRGFVQSWPQKKYDGHVSPPIRAVNIVVFPRQDGTATLSVNALVAVCPAASMPGTGARCVYLPSNGDQVPGGLGRLLFSNPTTGSVRMSAEVSVRLNPALDQTPVPDLREGRDLAFQRSSWTVFEGTVVATNTLVDGDDLTAWASGWRPKTREADEYLDLGEVRTVTMIRYEPGDANNTFRIDIAASSDGRIYEPVAGLTGFDGHRKWGAQDLRPSRPFRARFLRFHHVVPESIKTFDRLSLPKSVGVYAGVTEETWDMPKTGPLVGTPWSVSVEVPPGSFVCRPIDAPAISVPGAYLCGVKYTVGSVKGGVFAPFFVASPAPTAPAVNSRIGINAAIAEAAAPDASLGFGLVRFENFKWPMLSDRPGHYDFSGNVKPWRVDADGIVRAFAAHGMAVLPTCFMCPSFLSSAPHKAVRTDTWPPRDLADYREFCFQAAARYGRTKVDPATLLTDDKVSGLGQMPVFELWNEPNLINEKWGGWSTNFEAYLEMFRYGAEGVHAADPLAKVSNGGLAGIDLEVVDRFRTYTYADGRHPVDFIDVLNVHHYTGHVRPELARINTNIQRGPGAIAGDTFEDDLLKLVFWRDTYKPGAEIWMTETGYDTGGPRAVSPREQAAFLPRDVMIIFGAGIARVFIYRDTGDGASLYAASGLFRDDFSRKPSAYTVATMVRMIDGFDEAERLPLPDTSVRLYAFRRGQDFVVAAWAVQGEGVLGLDLGTCRAVDSFGATTRAAADRTFRLTEFPVYLTGFSAATATRVRALMDAAKTMRAQRFAARRRLALLRPVAFDFGSDDRVGAYDFGGIRSYTACGKVPWDEARGYGFTGDASRLRLENLKWVADAADGDNIGMASGQSFKFRAPAPGRYRLELSALWLFDDGALVFRGVQGAPGKLAVPRSDAVTCSFRVEVGSDPVEIIAEKSTRLAWIRLLPEP